MPLYKIKDHEVYLFPIRYLYGIFNLTRSGINKKIDNGHIPEPNFKNVNGARLFSVEDLAILDYVYKEIFPHSQGIAVPSWVKEMVNELFKRSKQIVINKGAALEADDWKEIDTKYPEFDRYRLQLYIDVWRGRVVVDKTFFPELVDENEI